MNKTARSQYFVNSGILNLWQFDVCELCRVFNFAQKNCGKICHHLIFTPKFAGEF